MYWRTGQALLDQMDEANRCAAGFGRAARQIVAAQLEGARFLQRIEEVEGWRCVGAAEAADLGERCGLTANAARTMLDLGRALKAKPDLEERVRAGKMTLESAALLGQVLPEKKLQRDGDDWVGWAESDSTRGFRLRVLRRKEEVALGTEEVIPIRLVVAERALEDFRRARAIASRKAGSTLTEGQVFATLADTYLDVFDELRVKPGKRRMPHTSLVNGRRVPAEVVREIYLRQGCKCAVPYCDHAIYLDKAHLVAHRFGGSREAYHLILLCRAHHTWLDAGYIKLTGTATNPRFTDREGRDLMQRCAQGDDYRYACDDDPDALPEAGAPQRPEGPPGDTQTSETRDPPTPPDGHRPAGEPDPP